LSSRRPWHEERLGAPPAGGFLTARIDSWPLLILALCQPIVGEGPADDRPRRRARAVPWSAFQFHVKHERSRSGSASDTHGSSAVRDATASPETGRQPGTVGVARRSACKRISREWRPAGSSESGRLPDHCGVAACQITAEWPLAGTLLTAWCSATAWSRGSPAHPDPHGVAAAAFPRSLRRSRRWLPTLGPRSEAKDGRPTWPPNVA
jgi:hypothetical protein